jgi:hypothetical protein
MIHTKYLAAHWAWRDSTLVFSAVPPIPIGPHKTALDIFYGGGGAGEMFHSLILTGHGIVLGCIGTDEGHILSGRVGVD